MNDDTGFLAAIYDAPRDTTIRLIYADWLDEREDVRGRLIRVEEEMRTLPAFADRYWLLKGERNELRAQVAPAWLEALRYGTDCLPLFAHGIPDGWRECWRLIREYVERWHGRPMPDIGGRLAEIQEVASRLGRTLPPSLREWVAFAHDLRTESPSHHVFRDVYWMEEVPGHAAVSLLLQCEGDYLWAVRDSDLAVPDPPIFGYHWDRENRDEETFVLDERNPIAGRVSSYTLDLAMSHIDSRGGGFSTDVADATRLIRDLAAAFPAPVRCGRTDLYEMENILIRLFPARVALGRYIMVNVAKPLPATAIPAFLWEYTRNGGSFHGMFTPPRRAAQQPAAPVAPEADAQDIPV